jgi:hypothetical protein
MQLAAQKRVNGRDNRVGEFLVHSELAAWKASR